MFARKAVYFHWVKNTIPFATISCAAISTSMALCDHQRINTVDDLPENWQFYFHKDKIYKEAILNDKKDHFIHKTLRGDHAIKMMRIFYSEDHSHVVCIVHTGPAVCGHPGANHGGFTAAVIDNSLGAIAYLNLSRPVTKSLTINYRSPLEPGKVMILSCHTHGSAREVISQSTGKSRLEQEVVCNIFQTDDKNTPATDKIHVHSSAIFVDVSGRDWMQQKAGDRSGGH